MIIIILLHYVVRVLVLLVLERLLAIPSQQLQTLRIPAMKHVHVDDEYDAAAFQWASHAHALIKLCDSHVRFVSRNCL